MQHAGWPTLLFALTLAACGGTQTSGTNGAGPATDDGNTRFVIPPINNSNATVAAETGPVVANITTGDQQTFQFAVRSGIAGINAEIVINSTANACNDANANVFHVNEQQLVITLTDIPDQQMAVNT